jgi:mRNA-degrading endonuclease RelE of RelBE toxin-antitoxin system
LRYQLSGWRVARRGDYHITFRILEGDRVLFIGRIEHRAHVYRRQ